MKDRQRIGAMRNKPRVHERRERPARSAASAADDERRPIDLIKLKIRRAVAAG